MYGPGRWWLSVQSVWFKDVSMTVGALLQLKLEHSSTCAVHALIQLQNAHVQLQRAHEETKELLSVQ